MKKTDKALLEPLTPRELEVLQMMGQGLSNRDIEEELVISISTVRWYLRQIYSKLDVHDRTEAVVTANQLGLLDDNVDQSQITLAISKNNIPLVPNPLLGRDTEIKDIKAWLTQSRLVTLTGVAGVGKTRLAVEVATQLSDSYAGVYFVDLAPVSEAGLVLETIASVLNIAETKHQSTLDQLQQHLQNRQALLILDNFEHLISAAPLVGALLSSVSDVSILITSREALRIYGEHEYAVPPLTLPDNWSRKNARILNDYGATALFIQRCKASKSDFEIDDETAPIIAEICWRLDGLPLPIELAATRIKLFTPQILLTHLKSRLKTLTTGVRDAPQRHKTLRDALDWSYDLLTDDEKRLFSRLGVFTGGRSLEAIEAICGVDLTIDVLDGLESLVNKSLLKVIENQSTQSPRFVMLETIHEYALEKLDQSGEASAFYLKHAQWYVDLAEAASELLRESYQKSWMDRLAIEEDNFRTILNRCRDHRLDPVIGLRLAGSLRHFWRIKGSLREADTWLNQMLDLTPEADPRLRAQVLCGAASFAYHHRDLDRVEILSNQALAISRQIGDKNSTAQALHFLAHVAQHDGDYVQGEALLSESLALSREIDDLRGTGGTLNCLGDACRVVGDYERGRVFFEEALSIFRELQRTLGISVILFNLGMLLQRLEEYDQATRYLYESFDLAVQINNEGQLSNAVLGLAGLSLAKGKAEQAAWLIGVGEVMLRRSERTLSPSDQIDYEAFVTATQQQLDSETFEKLRLDGQSLSLADAVEHITQTIISPD